MTHSIGPSEERTELMQQLAAGKYKSLPEVILSRMGRLIQEITRHHNPVSHWYSGTVMALAILCLSLIISILLDEFTPLRRESILLEIFAVTITAAGTVILAAYMGNVRAILHDSILSAINSSADVIVLRKWLDRAYNPRNHLIFSLAWSILLAPFAVIAPLVSSGGFIGVGPTITTLFAGIVAGMVIYFLILFLTLPARLSRYEFNLYAADPGNSEVVQVLSGMLMSGVYMMALFMAGTTLFLTVVSDVYGILGVVAVIAGWIPIAAWFALNQYALARIIRRAKWRTLNEIQAKIEQLRTQENIPSEQTLGHLNKLMDYHDRIRSTSNSALNLRAGLNFLNSLLLPLLAFVLANLDKILALFQ